MKKWVKKHKVLVIIVALVVVAIAVKSIFFTDAAQGYDEETVQTRDIVTYNSFVGNVAPASDIDLTAQASEEAVKVLVEKGDKVKEGDVIAKLDTTTVDYNIELQEASLEATKKNNKYNISDAKRGYENYKETVDSGLNSQLESARVQLESAEKALTDAKDEYDKAKKEIDTGTYSSIQSVYMQREQAYRSYQQASASASDAYDAYIKAKKAYDTAYSAVKAQAAKAATQATDATAAGAAATTTISSAELASLETAMDSAYSQYQSLDRTADSYYDNYTDAKKSFEDTKKSILENLEDSIENAQISYNNAKKSYDVVELAVEQQLGEYKAAYDKTKDLSDVSTAEIQLAQLKASREDYIIKAPASGTITSLSIEKGEMVTMGTPIATISDLEGMQVEIKVDEYTIKNVSVGDEVTIHVDALDKDYDGTLVEVDKTATIEGGVSYFNAKVNFTPDDDVKSGMSVEVKVMRVNEPDSISVSQSSLQYNDDNTAYVYMKDENGELVKVDVTLGASDGTYVQVTEGLAEGDVIYYPQSSIYSYEDMDEEDMDEMRDARNSMMLGDSGDSSDSSTSDSSGSAE